MTDKITISWTQLDAGLTPWWVGCWAMGKGSRFIYWCPVEDAVNERVNHDPDIGEWLAATGRDYVLVVLGRTGLALFEPGRIEKFNEDNGICYELEIPDKIAHSRNLDEIQEFLLERTMAALAAVAKKLRVAPPPSRAAGDLTGPPVPRGRMADIASKHGAGRPLVLLSPRYRHRPRFDELKASLAAYEIDIDSGWATYGVNPDATAHRADIDTEFDFTGIIRPFDPETLLIDSQTFVLFIASAEHAPPAQREQLAACAALVNEHIPIKASVAGNDNGVLWLAATMNWSRR